MSDPLIDYGRYGATTSRRTFLKSFLALAAVSACHSIPPGTSDAGSAFVAVARTDLSNLQTWLAQIGGTSPNTVVSAAVIVAQAAVTTAQNALNVYATTGGSVCSVLQASVTAAVNAAIAVLTAMQSTGVVLPPTGIIAVEAAGTILDSILGAVCALTGARRGAYDARTGQGTYVAAAFAQGADGGAPIAYLPLDPSVICPAP